MKFSVLMSLYVKENPLYLRECFESLQQQTLPADEIVLVFDGPVSEELEAIVQQFEMRLPIKTVKLAQNRGLGKALNEGLLHCSYDWVFRMDTDDICVPTRFEKQVGYIQQHPDVIIVGGQIAEFGQSLDEIVSYRNVPLSKADIVQFTRKRCPFNHMTVAYQKQAVLACGGYEDLQEDYYLWIKLVASGHNVANLPDILVYARVGNGMVGRRRGLAQAQAEWRLFKLKYRVKLQGMLSGLFTFLLRALPRLLPTSLLRIIYQFLRK
ncbi:TPA: glycosyltransferase family 2 protein [Pasteurella multocida]|uniref:glycosyltransferase family 2 protein n=1 Tax=Pasteurella multocida TaxID=747 RepID=UPI00028361F4|nr:glycosyltransferase [Pasteurella multocida]EJZ80604.1 Glycosyltransferases involved in cell wall biogenesis [Pasteurella multocida subsp. gallicida P1059]MEB3477202.1 glycosyltransferase [Pasteurella multocida]NMR23462.1 glycosyltransferase [Pasteurella multocida]NMR51475.1 glycosyltransferase [Pasteurella multocida]NMR61415.1 glycosyltransferase [Pasteurella multocida]